MLFISLRIIKCIDGASPLVLKLINDLVYFLYNSENLKNLRSFNVKKTFLQYIYYILHAKISIFLKGFYAVEKVLVMYTFLIKQIF